MRLYQCNTCRETMKRGESCFTVYIYENIIGGQKDADRLTYDLCERCAKIFVNGSPANDNLGGFTPTEMT